MTWQNIPRELQALNTWCAATPNRKPIDPISEKAVGCDSKLYTFDQITELAKTEHIGVWLVDTDLFCIDVDHLSRPSFDHMDEHTKQRWKKETKHLLTCPTYIEYSASGVAFHVWGKGSLPNKEVGNFDIRSNRRFLVCTGKAYNKHPIVENKKLIQHLQNLIGSEETLEAQVTTVNEDEKVLQQMFNASNGAVAKALYEGDASNYKSQSEADHALITFLHYHSADREQALRLYARSSLASRPRIQKKGVETHFNFSYDKINNKAVILEQVAIELPQPEEKKPKTKDIEYPDNLVGELAQYVHDSAVRPLSDLSLLSSLLWFAGICGRAYNVSETGLNLYMAYLGGVGTGKEQAQSGLSRLTNAISVQVPSVIKFTGPRKFASGPALLRWLEKHPSFYTVLPEFSEFLTMLQGRSDAYLSGLQQLVNDLFNKSGAQDFLPGSVYADSANNIGVIRSPAVSFLGESTPSTVLDLLTNELLESGFLSRVLLFFSYAKRPSRNLNRSTKVPEILVKKCSEIVECSLTLMQKGRVCDVKIEKDAETALNDFDSKIDARINKSQYDALKHVWTRNHLQALRISGLLAIAEQPYKPVVRLSHAQWAMERVQACAEDIGFEFESGRLGSQFLRTREKVIGYCQQWLNLSMREKYRKRASKKLAETKESVVPEFYLTKCLLNLSYVNNHRKGHDAIIRSLLQSLIEENYLTPLSKDARLLYGIRGSAYRVTSTPTKD